jgi:hypothetical protein
MKQILLGAAALCASTTLAASAQAASLVFAFDRDASELAVTQGSKRCLPSSGCSLTATMMSLPELTIEEGAGNARTFNFAQFNVTPGFGGDSGASIEATLALTSPLVGTTSSTGTASYLRLGGFLTPGVTTGSLVWNATPQQYTTADGSKYTVAFNDLYGVTFGGNAYGSMTIRVDSVASLPPTLGAVPEPATWATMVAGFGMAGTALRRRRRTTALSAA